jgi:two-component system phosphate regulon response regulator PhoB
LSERILVIEDERDIAQVLEYNLRRAGYEPLTAYDGASGLRLARDAKPALVLLDLMLPDVSGQEICRRLRADAATASMPVVMVTARGEESDRVGGLEAGADDYVTKPFSIREVILRVGAVLRRRAASAASSRSFGPLVVDSDAHRVSVDGKTVDLTATEFRLLEDLIGAAGTVRSRDSLLDRVWGYAPEVVSRTVDTHVRRLREKLGSAGHLIETVRGIGYRFHAPAGKSN